MRYLSHNAPRSMSQKQALTSVSASHKGVRQESVRTRAHVDSGAITLMIINYLASLITLIITGVQLTWRAAFVTALFIVNLVSLTRTHLMLVSKPGPKSLALFLINAAPYVLLLANPQPWLVIPIIPLTVFLISVIRGHGRSITANVAGTVLIASTYLPWYVMAGGYASPRILIAYITWVIYHLFTSIYVEGKLPFRRSVKPWYASIPWLSSLPFIMYFMIATSSIVMPLILLEPTVRAFIALREGKLGMDNLRGRIRRMGILLTIESIIVMALLLIYVFSGHY